MQALKCILFYLFLCYKNCNAIKGLRNKNMVGKITRDGKRSVGRPLGSGSGQQIVSVLRRGFEDAIEELDARGKSLSMLLAEAMERDINGTVRTMSALLPKDVELKVSASDNLSDALSMVSVKLAERRNAPTIDIEPDDSE